MSSWMQGAPQMVAAFLGSSVEAVEAMTIVLAAGAVRGWRSALMGSAGGLVTLAAIVVVFGSALAAIPIDYLQIAVGTALLLFGIRWLRKAVLRSAGVVALHDESAIYATQTNTLQSSERAAPDFLIRKPGNHEGGNLGGDFSWFPGFLIKFFAGNAES